MKKIITIFLLIAVLLSVLTASTVFADNNNDLSLSQENNEQVEIISDNTLIDVIEEDIIEEDIIEEDIIEEDIIEENTVEETPLNENPIEKEILEEEIQEYNVILETKAFELPPISVYIYADKNLVSIGEQVNLYSQIINEEYYTIINYQWKITNDNGITWENIPKANNNVYSFIVTEDTFHQGYSLTITYA